MTNVLFVGPDLVLHGDFCGERVVGVPFLVEAEAQVLHFVLGLQVAAWLPCICVVGARGGKLLQDTQGWSDDERDEDGIWGEEKGEAVRHIDTLEPS